MIGSGALAATRAICARLNDSFTKKKNNHIFPFLDEVVGTVTAFDADDVTLGTNALLAYSLEKNVVEEHTGERLFKINSTSGEIRTALCCLDREVTSLYRLQVVATDGGGLQGKTHFSFVLE